MSDFNRRRFLEGSATVAAAATLGTGAAVFAPAVHAQNVSFKPEKGAKLRVLRWSRFVQGDIDQYMKNVAAFTAKTGIEVRVDNENWEDVRPKAAVAEAMEAAALEIADITERLLTDVVPPRRRPPKSVPPLRRPEVRKRMGREPSIS